MIKSQLKENSISIFIGTFLLMSVAFYNAYPLVYSDTGTYLYSGFDLFVPKDRPMLYGLLLRFTSFKFSLWFVVFFQNLLTSFLIFEVIGIFVKKHRHALFLFVVLFLTASSSIGWYSNQIMPDFFAPLLILSWIWILFGTSSNTLKKSLIWLIFIVANCVHFSHLFISTLLLFPVLLKTFQLRKNPNLNYANFKKKASLLLSLVLISWIALPSIHAQFNGGFKLSKGSHVFLVAHLNEKGLLKAVLDQYCETEQLTNCSLCEEKDNLPQDIDAFIWSGDFLERHGGWEDSKESFDQIIALSLKNPNFLFKNIFYSTIYGFSQLPQIEIGEGLTAYNEHSAPYGQIAWRFPGELNAYLNSKQNKYDGINLQFNYLNVIQWFSVVLSLVFLIMLSISKKNIGLSNNHRYILYFILFALLANALVTAGLSAPYTRYQSRVIWLLPFFSMLFGWLYRKKLSTIAQLFQK